MRLPLMAAITLPWFLAAANPSEGVDYARQVKPILEARCLSCHGALQQRSGLRVDTARSLLRGGEGGPAVVSGDSRASLLIERVSGKGETRMPPESEGDGLKAAQIALLITWIDQGAKAPPDERPEPDPRDHWAFRKPSRSAVPTPARSGPANTPANPIDAFLADGLQKRGLKPQPPADPRLQLRRLYIDLVGLPPTAEELDAYESNREPDRYEKVVDRLLASPQHGERWGRHWMDVWRYSDPWGLGGEVRNSQKHIWHWRDWIVESLNADKGYDQMIREMLAADELYPNDLARLRATGFLVRPYFKFNRNTWLEETVEHIGKGLLGLTLNCAKCHDHKYDPIRQTDYYRFRAFFEPYQLRTDQLPGQPDVEKDGIPRAFDCNLDAPTFLFARGDESRPLKDRPLSPGLPPVLLLGDLKIQPVPLPPEASSPGLRSFVVGDLLHEAETRARKAHEALEQARAAWPKGAGDREKAKVEVAEKALSAANALPEVIRARGDADRARFERPRDNQAEDLAGHAARLERRAALAGAEEYLARAALALFDPDPGKGELVRKSYDAAKLSVEAARKGLETAGVNYTPIAGARKTPESNLETADSRNKPFPATSTGRRTALAHWMTDPRHPLTARVAVNQVWMRHFGKPLVSTVFDFGRKSTPPTHPELLDWLSAELVENSWSLKHLHRLIVLSEAYRRTSSSARADGATLTADPENRWYWRRDSVRMESQVIRDSLLQIAGALDPAIGGPPVAATDDTSRRRSLYFVHSHNERLKFLSAFDDAGVQECYRRSESIVPAQALALSNSRLVLSLASRITDRLQLIHGAASDRVFVRAAFGTVLAIAPDADEQEACEQSLADMKTLLAKHGVSKPVLKARENLVRALLNHNDFVTVR